MAHVTTAPGLGRRTWSALAVTVLFAILAAFADANDFVRVKRVIDGDTIMLESGERVRLIGVDTPESVDPRRR